jgi:hypothetical protein
MIMIPSRNDRVYAPVRPFHLPPPPSVVTALARGDVVAAGGAGWRGR